MASNEWDSKFFSKTSSFHHNADNLYSLPNCFLSNTFPKVMDKHVFNLDNHKKRARKSATRSLPKLNMINIDKYDNLFERVDRDVSLVFCNNSRSDVGEQKSMDDEKALSSFNVNGCIQDDATSILKDLDNIINVHGNIKLTNLNSLETKVEDCLMDLDNYLDELDSSSLLQNEGDIRSIDNICIAEHQPTRYHNRSLPNTRRKNVPVTAFNFVPENNNISDVKFKRQHKTRSTISCSKEKKCDDLIRNNQESTSVPSRSTQYDFVQESQWEKLKMEGKVTECLRNPISKNQGSETTLAESKRLDLIDSNSFEDRLRETTQMHRNSDLRRYFSQNRLSTVTGRNETLTQEDIFSNILLQNDINSNITGRPRQFGRRVEGHPQILPIRSEILSGNGSFIIMNHTQRPLSAPSISARALRDAVSVDDMHIMPPNGSEASSVHSSGHSSPITIISSSDSGSTPASISENLQITLETSEQLHNLSQENTTSSAYKGVNSVWPHNCSRALALVCCTLGLFNISRFSVLTIQYGGNFVLQFLILSTLFGIPLFLLQMCLGSKIRAGPISMWKISPICRGIGIAIVMVQCFIAIYSTVAIAWIFFYLRDSFPSKNHSKYLFEKIINTYRWNVNNTSLAEKISDYFNIVVLQRFQLLKSANNINYRINNWMAFNLAIIWAIVFLILCKGLKSFGKAVFILTVAPLTILVAVVCKLLYIVDPGKLQDMFTTADFDEFLVNSKTWIAAAQEVFITWGFLGSSVISITSRSYTTERSMISLRRDAIFAVLITLFGLCVAALFGACCAQILKQHAYIYVPGSFENLESSRAVYSVETLTNTSILSFPPKWMHHYSNFIGETYRRHYSHNESGYQALRFITEIFPATLMLSHKSVSWIWAVMTFLAFITLGISQLSAMWKPILSSLGNSISSVLLCCATAFLFGVPFTSDVSISIIHYLDFVLGGSWFVPILWTAQIFGVFLIRGRPYNGDDLVNNLKMSGSLSAFTALSWNVLLPIGLITLSIVNYRTSFSNQIFYWRGKSYFNYWSRKLAASIQIGFLLIIPVASIIQIYRYLTKGPSDILDRIQLLYRPGEDLGSDGPQIEPGRTGYNGLSDDNHTISNIELRAYSTQDDSPPKYTPPPSYTTATGARFAKILRRSIRRSIQRILCERGRLNPAITSDCECNQTNSCGNNTLDLSSEVESNQPSTSNNIQRSFSLGYRFLKKPAYSETVVRKSDRNRSLHSPFTANDVVAVLRSSSSWGTRTATSSREILELNSVNDTTFRSIDNLMINAEALDQSSAIMVCDGEAGSSPSVI